MSATAEPTAAAAALPWRDTRLKALVAVAVVVITASHFLVPMDQVVLHNLLRRLYYVPIVVAAVGFGARGGLFTAFLCTLAYLPHAFFMQHDHAAHDHGGHAMPFGMPLSGDPSPEAEKLVELLVFHGVGWLTGALSERWTRALRQAEALTRRLEAALAERDRMRDQLVRTEKLGALGHLSAGLAHELRNPLSSIRGSAEVLAEDVPRDSPKGRLAGILLSELERLDNVLTQFLQFARPPRPQPTAVDVPSLLDEVAAMTASAREVAHITLTRTGTAARAWVDDGQLRQVLLNLVRNAMEAMPQGGALSLTARDGAFADGAPAVCVDVTDTGPGIAPDTLPKIFEPYFTTKDTGTGLGLSISHALVEANRGVVDVRSTVGAGTTFTLVLPRHRG